MALEYRPVNPIEPRWKVGNKRTMLPIDWLILLGLGLLAILVLLALI